MISHLELPQPQTHHACKIGGRGDIGVNPRKREKGSLRGDDTRVEWPSENLAQSCELSMRDRVELESAHRRRVNPPGGAMLPLKQHLLRDSVMVRRSEYFPVTDCTRERPVVSKKRSGPPWLRLERHFARHKALVERFRDADASSVRRMWRTQTNEAGAPLSRDERQALMERHCELFGHWPHN